MNMVGFLEDKFPVVRQAKEEIRMKNIGSPIQIISPVGKLTKRGQHTSISPNKRVILGRKNQLIRMMKRSGTEHLLKSRYIRIN